MLVTLGALLRTVVAAAAPAASSLLLTLAAVFWSGAFAVFLVGFAGILIAPRVDAQPG